MGLAGEPKSKEGGAAVPFKPKMNTTKIEEASSLKPKETEINISEEEEQAGPRKGKNRTGKGNLKRVAREAGKARGVGSSSLEIVVGAKRREDTDTLAEREGRPQKKKAAKRKVRAMLFFAKISLRNRQWLLGSTAGSNDCLGVELPGAWEPLDSSGVGRISPTLESQNYFFVGNKS